jgi:MFS family permease
MIGKWVILFIISAGVFLANLDVTVNVALPELSRYFQADPGIVYLIIVAYVGTSVALQISIGKAGDVYGLRGIYLFGLCSYSISMVCISLSQDIFSVIALRVIQAIGNAVFLAICPAFLSTVFPIDVRGRVLGLMTAIGSFGMIIGTLSAGFILEYLSWHWIFLGRLPFCIIAIIGTIFILKNPEENRWNYADKNRMFDIKESILLFSFIMSIVIFVNIAASEKYLLLFKFIVLLPVPILFLMFIRYQRVTPNPLLQIEILNKPVLLMGFISNSLLWFATFINFYILPYFITNILKLPSRNLGLLLMSSAIGNSIFSPIAGFLSDKFKPGIVSFIAYLIVTITTFSFTSISTKISFSGLIIRTFFIGIGVGSFTSANQSMVITSIGKKDKGIASALSSVSRGVGIIASVPIMGNIFEYLYDNGSNGIKILNAASTEKSVVSYFSAIYSIYWVSLLFAFLGLISVLISWKYDLKQSYL